MYGKRARGTWSLGDTAFPGLGARQEAAGAEGCGWQIGEEDGGISRWESRAEGVAAR